MNNSKIFSSIFAVLFCGALILSILAGFACADEPLPVDESMQTASPIPATPTPTPKIMPGSPLIFGSEDLGEAISQFDIFVIAEIVLIVLGIVWAIVISVAVIKKLKEL